MKQLVLYRLVGCVALVLLLVGLTVVWQRDHAPALASRTSVQQSTAEKSSLVGCCGEGGPGDLDPIPTPNESTALVGFSRWPAAQRRETLVSLAHSEHLGMETAQFLLSLIADRSVTAVQRNLAANVLTSPGRTPSGLQPLLSAQAIDPNEDPAWRDYALQHLATMSGSSGSPQSDGIVWTLTNEIERYGNSAGTALLQLQRLDADKGIPMDLGLLNRVAHQAFANPSANLNTTISVIGVIGQRRERSFLPQVRSLASSAPAAAIRRSALGALGLLGDESDVEIISAAITDIDPTVAQAARIAQGRLVAARTIIETHSL